jgi:hypothetical protein
MDKKGIEAYVVGLGASDKSEWRRFMNVSAWNVLTQPSDCHLFQKQHAIWFCKTYEFES